MAANSRCFAMNCRHNAWSLGIAVLASINFLLLTGMINESGHLYSGHLAFRQQTDAFLRGAFAVDEKPSRISWDFASAHGVQQSWGLGIPAWRLPFEIATRFTGSKAFPDRLAFVIAVVLTFFFVVRVFLSHITLRDTLTIAIDQPARIIAPL